MVRSSVIGTVFLLVAFNDSALGDGGTLRFWDRGGPYEIAVFTLPTRLCVGPVDISVLVLDPRSGDPIPHANVSIELAPLHDPERTTRRIATPGAAVNKLFFAATFTLSHSGLWLVQLTVQATSGSQQVRFMVEAVEDDSTLPVLWPWFSWPAVVVTAYAFHQWLVFRKTQKKVIAQHIDHRHLNPS